MRGDKIGLDQGPCIGVLRQEMDMHLIRTNFRAFVAEMGEIEGHRIVSGLTEGKRRARAVIIAADQDVICLRDRWAPDQGIDAVQIAPSRGPAPIVKGLVEGGFLANQRRLVGGPPLGRLSLDFAHPHRIPAR